MSISNTRHLLTRLLSNSSSRKYIECLGSSVRFKSSEPGKIESALLKKFSEPLVIESLDPPKSPLQPSEVLIDVTYCALNGPDVLLCEKLYSHEPSLPFVPGYEVCGKLLQVSQAAKEAGFNVGDKVVALNGEAYGGLAEQCRADVNDIWRVPTSIKSVDAVCLLENYMTALIGLEQYGSIAEEDMVLVNVGIGGIGLAAVDIAANIFRAKVIGVGFSEDRADRIRERGAFHAFTYKEKKLQKEIEEAAAERDIKDIFKDESGEHFKKVLNTFMSVYKSKTPSKNLLRTDNFGVIVQHLSRDGKIIIAGVADTNPNKGETKEDKDWFTVTGIDLKDYRNRKLDLYRQTGDDVISFFEEGLIKPIPAMVAGLYNVNEAVKFMSEMKACGKVIIDMKNKDTKATVR